MNRFDSTMGSLLLWLSILGMQSSRPTVALAEDTPLETIKKAFAASSEEVQSASGIGTFEQFEREPGDREFKLRTRARVKVLFDQGKYHLRFDYETKLVRTVYKDMEGNKIAEKLAEWRPDRLFVIYDGASANVVTFAERIRPRGCDGEVYSNLNLGVLPTGFPWRNPARLGKESMDIDKLIQDSGDKSIEVVELPEGGIRGTYRPKHSDKVRVEFDTDPDVQFNIVGIRKFVEGHELPVSSTRLTWKKVANVWCVHSIHQELRGIKGLDSENRSVFKYDTLEVNTLVDPNVFTLAIAEVPRGTRFIDHRENATNRFLYYDGSDLTPQRQ